MSVMGGDVTVFLIQFTSQFLTSDFKAVVLHTKQLHAHQS